MRRLLQMLVVFGLLFPCGQSANAQSILTAAERAALPFNEQDLVGTFSSRSCDNLALAEDGQISNIRRFYNWDRTTYAVSYTFFADDSCAHPLFTFFFAGPYELGRARPDLGRVREVQIVFDTVTMRADSEAGAAVLRGACGPFDWRAGMIRDVGPHSCLIKAPRSECIGDNELLMLDGDRLAPGVRTMNMCEPAGRPRAIQTAPAFRVSR